MAETRIRPAKASDAADLAAAFEAAYEQYAARIPDLPDVSGGLAEDIATHHVWVAEHSGQIVGGVVLTESPDRAHLANIAIAPQASGLGLGRALMEAAETASRAMGHSEMHLSTHAAMPGNVAMYQHLGWQVIARSGRRVRMVKALFPDSEGGR